MPKKSKPVPAAAEEMSCSDGWYVTGYYTCAEAQFHGSPIQIIVTGVGPDQFPSDFLSAVRIEGWGQTRNGWFLGWSGGKWVRGNAPLNAVGKPLQTGTPNSLAVDRSVIPIGTRVMIPSLPAPWNTTVFVADDTGGAIIGKHVDVYCGVGAQAETETSRVTSHAGRVCLG
jgi:3D (Asp-Asp-Asp) domain-containing protein